MICKYFLPFCRPHFHFVDCIFQFTSLMVWYSPIYLSLLFCLYFWCYNQKPTAKSNVINFPLMLSSMNFIVISLTFRSLIFFLLIFECGIRKCPTSFFCIWICSFPNTICWIDGPFPLEWSWHPCQKSPDHICKGLFLSSL